MMSSSYSHRRKYLYMTRGKNEIQRSTRNSSSSNNNIAFKCNYRGSFFVQSYFNVRLMYNQERKVRERTRAFYVHEATFSTPESLISYIIFLMLLLLHTNQFLLPECNFAQASFSYFYFISILNRAFLWAVQWETWKCSVVFFLYFSFSSLRFLFLSFHAKIVFL